MPGGVVGKVAWVAQWESLTSCTLAPVGVVFSGIVTFGCVGSLVKRSSEPTSGVPAVDDPGTAAVMVSVPIAPGQQVSVTVSLGGAYAPQWVRSSPTLWVERADQQLYRAKQEGRNRACLEQPPSSLVSPEEKGLLFGTSQFQEFL